MMKNKLLSIVLVGIITSTSFMLVGWNDYPTVHEYMLETRNTELVAAATYRIDGYRAICGRRPTVLNSRFDSWGGSYPGFIIMNPKANKKLPTTVKLFIYSHECGHQFGGANETRADNFAIRRGIMWGWLKNKTGMRAICRFISKIPADSVHPAGPVRCRQMTTYFNTLMQKRARK